MFRRFMHDRKLPSVIYTPPKKKIIRSQKSICFHKCEYRYRYKNCCYFRNYYYNSLRFRQRQNQIKNK